MSTVFATFSVLKDHVKLKAAGEAVTIDNIVFRLHYRATFLLLIIGSLLVSSRQFIGEHIRCIADTSVPNRVIETFCFFTSTFTVAKHMNLSAVRDGTIAHPGVGPVKPGDEVVHHAYYQWVPFFLFFQGILFYLPHYFWKLKEGGRMKALVTGLHMASLSIRDEPLPVNGSLTVPSKNDLQKKIQTIRTAFLNRLHVNRPWAYYLCVFELLNFIIVVSQIYVTNSFLGGAFLRLGHRVANGNFDEDDTTVDILDTVFPKMTKCTFHKYGQSGSIQQHDALCVMALNVVNEKIYTFLWFWLIILAVITGVNLVWRILTMLLHARSKRFNKLVFGMACPGTNNPWSVLKVTRQYNFSDWLFLYYIAKNLDNSIFSELFKRLARDLQHRQDRGGNNEPLPLIPENDREEKLPLNIYDEQKRA
ncbi:innexin inx7 [Athalia rosae]|uniref:innexin inx7 n=1 Tax=Athalia rosae TaxID=37344 RepID=UPI002033C945|nr:innexin inx7 [Athalia rosae]